MRSPGIAVLVAGVVSLALAGCATDKIPQAVTYDRIGEELRAATTASNAAKASAADKAAQAMLPSLDVELPKSAQEAVEPRFDLAVSGAPAAQVFMAIVSGTRYSMLLAPELSGTISVSLKNVTVREALDSIRELYGYDYRVTGSRIFVQTNAMQSKVFQVNYLSGRRRGQSDLRVTSSSITGGGAGGTGGASSTPATGAAAGSSSTDSARVSMSTDVDFWAELRTALTAIVGTEGGRSVIINPMSGVVVLRGMPADIRNVEQYLQATQLIVDRQVMLEAKIIEVALNEEYQSGVNWASFNGTRNRFSTGVTQPGAVVRPLGGQPVTNAGTMPFQNSTDELTTATAAVVAGTGGGIVASAIGNGFLGLAFQSANFAALLNFLESQGSIQVLSSPRIATLNNQKAVLKVGADEFFVTNVTTSTSTSGTSTVSSPTITLQPFFSGIALDVTPQIDDANNITLHVHPSISVVGEKQKIIDLGTLGQFNLPLAASSINETDSIVRVQNGNIVAIGGLMKQEQSSDRSQLPGAGDLPGVGSLFGQRSRALKKRELVILIRPTIIQPAQGWNQDLHELQQRLPELDPRRHLPASAAR